MSPPEVLTQPPLGRFLSNERVLGGLLGDLLDAARANDGDRVARIWEELEPAITLHLELEARHLLPRLFASSAREARVLVQEQKHLRNRLDDLKAGASRRALRPGTVRDFIDVLRAHARHQERHRASWCDDVEDGTPSAGTRQ